MKKMMIRLLAAVFMLLTVLQPVHAQEKAKSKTVNTDYSNYELIESSVKHTATRFYVQVKAKRGTTVYYDDWMRSF